jgi:hypothetical protein
MTAKFVNSLIPFRIEFLDLVHHHSMNILGNLKYARNVDAKMDFDVTRQSMKDVLAPVA